MNKIWLTIQLLATLLLIAFAYYLVSSNYNQILKHQLQLQYGYIALGLFLAWLQYTLTYLRWSLILKRYNIHYSGYKTVKICFVGELFGLVSFGTLGADFLKSFVFMKEFPQRKQAVLGSILLDRSIGLAGIFTTGTIFIFIIPSIRKHLHIEGNANAPLTLVIWTMLAGFIAIWGLLAIVLLLSRSNNLKETNSNNKADKISLENRSALTSRMIEFIHNLRREFSQIRISGRDFFKIVSLTLCINLAAGGLIYCAGCGLSLTIPNLGVHFFLSPAITLSSLIPLPLGAIGAGEVMLDYLYRWVGPGIMLAGVGVLILSLSRTMAIFVVFVAGGSLYYLIHNFFGFIRRPKTKTQQMKLLLVNNRS